MSDLTPTCAHGWREGDCPACAACAACDGRCGTCPYLRPVTGPDLTPDQRETARVRRELRREVGHAPAADRKQGKWQPWVTAHEVGVLLDALDAADAARMVAEAEQRGREDNADHGMCYVSGSKALAARDAEAEQRGAARVAAAVEALATEWYPGTPGPRRMVSWGQLAMEKCARELRAALAQAAPTESH